MVDSLDISSLKLNYDKFFTLQLENLKIKTGNVLGILGPNGSGKTSLINCILGFNENYKGKIQLNDKDLKKLTIQKRAKLIGYQPQNIEVVFGLDVFNMILMGRRPYSPWRYCSRDIDCVNTIIDDFKLQKIRNKDFSQLSGGEKQIVILARTFAQDTKILVCDEPNNNLDICHIKRIMQEIQYRTKKKNIISIVVLHDINIALKYCDELLFLNRGEIFSQLNDYNKISVSMLEELYKVPMTIHYDNTGRINFVNTLG